MSVSYQEFLTGKIARAADNGFVLAAANLLLGEAGAE